MDDIFTLKGNEHADPTISFHTTGTVHIFNLSLCLKQQNMAYTNVSPTPITHVPLFVAPREVSLKTDPELFYITGGCHDIAVPVTVTPELKIIVDISVVQSLLLQDNYAGGKIQPNLGDAYTITNATQEGNYLKLIIPDNNFVQSDDIIVNGKKHTIVTKQNDQVFIDYTENDISTYIDASARLTFGNDFDADPCELEPQKASIRFLGITGAFQPYQYQYGMGITSVATIVDGDCLLLMTEEMCSLFIPGDLVYLHMFYDNNSDQYFIEYSPVSKQLEAVFSTCLGTFIEQRAHTKGALGNICLGFKQPPSFILNND